MRPRVWASILFLLFFAPTRLEANAVLLDLDAATAEGEDTIRITFKHDIDGDGDYTTKQLTVKTGKVDKGTTAEKKAEKYAQVIEAASAAFNEDGVSDPVSATSGSDSVTISTNSTKIEITDVDITEKTGQKVKIRGITDGSGVVLGPTLIASVTLIGRISGYNFDGSMSYVSVETKRHTAQLQPARFSNLSELALALVNDLERHGIRATMDLQSPEHPRITIILDPERDEYIGAGSDDRSMDLSIGMGRL
ncbi:MAG: hypothetical protein HY812_17450 [Planctomycetes bacterium]|nr:hypothetical protein [Planctomycetota bacterium]